MKLSLVLHANGPDPKDYNAYLTTAKTYQDNGSWFRIGRLQSVRFAASAKDIAPAVHGSFIGIAVNKCEEPNLSDGVNVFYSEFVLIDEPQSHGTFDVLVRNGYQPMGWVQEILFDVDVNGFANLHIKAVDIVEWANDLPKWIDLKLINLAQDDSKPEGNHG